MLETRLQRDGSRGFWHPDPRDDLRYEWKGSVLARFRDHVARHPAALCLVSADERLTYSAVDAASDKLAKEIRARSPRHAAVLSIVADRSPRLTIALLAALKEGLAFNIVDPKYPLRRILACLKYVRPAGLINTSRDRDICERLAGQLSRCSACFSIDVEDRLVVSHNARESGSAVITEGLAINANSPMYVTFTSGTTGFPRAVWGSHGPVSHFFDWQHRQFKIAPTDRVSVLSGLAHDVILRDLLMPLWAGCSSWFPPKQLYSHAGAMYAWLQANNITILHLTPSLCQLLLTIPKSELSPCLPNVRLAFFGGEALTMKLARRFQSLAPNAEIVNCYGTTETPQVMGFYVFGSGEPKGVTAYGEESALVPIGHGIEGVQLLLLDVDNRICGEEVRGEIFIRTPYRAMRVEDIQGKSASCYIRNPFSSSADDLLYRTGDCGKYLNDGTVLFLGRRDRQVKIRGFRVELGEVERAVQGCRGVDQSHVDVVVEDQHANLALFVVSEPGVPIDPEVLRSDLMSRLPAFMVPQRILVLPSLPQTPNGKLDCQRLRDMIERKSDSFRTPAGPAADVSDDGDAPAILGRLRSLAVPMIDEDQFIRPMDSLQLVELGCMLEHELGVDLPIEELQHCTTLHALAERVMFGLKGRTDIDRAEFGTAPMPKLRASESDHATRRWLNSGSDRPRWLRWVPGNERIWEAFANRILQLAARIAPDPLRVRLHRMRGVQIGNDVSIGYDTIIETAFPWLVQLGHHTNIGMRVTVIGHFRGMELVRQEGPTVIIDDYSFVGPGAIILPNVTVGRGSVVAAGSIVSASIPPYCFAQGNPARVVARCGVPLSGSTSYAEFLNQLVPLSRKPGQAPVEARPVGDDLDFR